MLLRLAPLEARLAEIERGLAERDPQALLDRFAERLEAVQGRLAALEGAENPFGEIAEQLTRLYAQKDATVEAVFARLAPLEAQLAGLEGGLGAAAAAGRGRPAGGGRRPPRPASRRCTGRRARSRRRSRRCRRPERGRPPGRVADQLTRLYAQKDAGLAALMNRLAPLEARLAALEARPWDPEAEAARAEAQAVAAQLIAAHAAAEQTALFADRISHLEARLPRLTAGADRRRSAAWLPPPIPPRRARSAPPRRSTRSGACRGWSRCTSADGALRPPGKRAVTPV